MIFSRGMPSLSLPLLQLLPPSRFLCLPRYFFAFLSLPLPSYFSPSFPPLPLSTPPSRPTLYPSLSLPLPLPLYFSPFTSSVRTLSFWIPTFLLFSHLLFLSPTLMLIFVCMLLRTSPNRRFLELVFAGASRGNSTRVSSSGCACSIFQRRGGWRRRRFGKRRWTAWSGRWS